MKHLNHDALCEIRQMVMLRKPHEKVIATIADSMECMWENCIHSTKILVGSCSYACCDERVLGLLHVIERQRQVLFIPYYPNLPPEFTGFFMRMDVGLYPTIPFRLAPFRFDDECISLDVDLKFSDLLYRLYDEAAAEAQFRRLVARDLPAAACIRGEIGVEPTQKFRAYLTVDQFRDLAKWFNRELDVAP